MENIRLISAGLASEAESCIMTKTFIIDKGQKSTDEPLQEVTKAKNRPIYRFLLLFEDLIL